MSYAFLSQLPVVRESESGWWKLAWRPIRRGTWNLYLSRWIPFCNVHHLYHANFWYCRPVKPDCDAEFEKWLGGDRGKLCHLCQGIPCDACKQMSREIWRAARGK